MVAKKAVSKRPVARKKAAKRAARAEPKAVEPASAPSDSESTPDDAELVPPTAILEDAPGPGPRFAPEPVYPEGVEDSLVPSVQIHTHRGRTIELDKVTMSTAERLVAIERFEAAVDAELDG